MPDNSKLLTIDILDKHDKVVNQISPGTNASRRINRLLKELNLNSYLEIGVNTGRTFFDVKASSKTAVDPKFRFDKNKYQSDGIEFFETSSDDFFNHNSLGKKFDLIFLDGLHVFEQTFRDFCACMSCINEKSIIIIDDVMPDDVYSAIPNQSETYKFRKAFGINNLSWHGDIYKIVFLIHDFFINFNYLTIHKKGNPQLILWRDTRKNFTPIFNSLEKISRLSFFDFYNLKNVLNLMEDEIALHYIIDRLQNNTR